jgi:AraC-like DNA-binding protein
MSPTFWNVTFGIGLAQGAFLVLALLLRRSRNRRAAGALMAIVAVMASMSAVELARGGLTERTGLLLSYLTINVELVIGPLVLLFVRSLLDPERRVTAGDARHALPFLTGLALWSAGWLLVEDQGHPFGLELETVAARFVLLKGAVLCVYAALVVRTLRPALRRPGGFTIGRRRVGVEWLARWLLGGCAVVAVLYLAVFLEHQGVPLPFEPDQLGSLLLTGLIYFLSLMVLLRPWFLSLRPHPAATEPWSSDVAHLNAVLERRRPWLDPELGLRELAASTGFTESRLSALINEGLSTSFYGLLNRYRVAEFERLARDPALRDRTVLELALRSGFNSKASFYRKFRETHGTTPTAWREGSAARLGSH